MAAFRFTRTPIDGARLTRALADPGCGGFASFEGWVRDENEGQRVAHLQYEAFESLALREGERILEEARARYIIDEVKHRLPIWKKEHYVNGDSGWVNCQRCATPATGEPPAHEHAQPR